ncbi:flagellar hook-length control protein FliK [Hafnia alvei]|uniref:Flagellar hook-length control protein FliK n=1 Tax=Hafnia alvei TaxID=569 RepID=A0A1C6YX43_HAFAL|nr:flagellar hook-length control protein FliK [Hafnia alvei]NLS53833.1 flagellar hook-length control protein FliK [Hafnia alvei]SCM51467.1 flagellar hook-length control protein FliK [Hafnia alvei]
MTSPLLAVAMTNPTAANESAPSAKSAKKAAAPFSNVLSQAHSQSKENRAPHATTTKSGSGLAEKADLKTLQAALAKTLQNQSAKGEDTQKLLGQLATLDPKQQQKLLASLSASLADKKTADKDDHLQTLTETVADKGTEQAGQAAISALFAMLPDALPKVAASDTADSAEINMALNTTASERADPLMNLLTGEDKKEAKLDLGTLLKSDKPSADADSQQLDLSLAAVPSKKSDPSVLKSSVETSATPLNTAEIPLKLAPQLEDARLPRSDLNLSQQPTHTLSQAMHNIAVSSPVVAPQTTAVPAAPMPTPVLNAQLGSSEWQQALGQQILMFNRSGQHSAELRLHPQDLGSLQISLRIDDNQAQLHMASGHSQVRAALEAALPQLRTALADSGIQLGQSSVGSEAQPQWSGGQQNASDRQATSGGFSVDGNNDDRIVTASVSAKSVRVGGVDISV